MKKIFFLVLLFVVNILKAQDYYSELNSDIYTATQIVGGNNISSPDVEAFQKVNMVPVSNYTGRINLSIPFYEIKVGNISIPISLSYNSSGVKVNDMASNVGLNWSLNAGGVISKITKGIDDFKSPLLTGTIRYHRPSGILSYVNYPVHIFTLAEHNDVEADVFQATAPGLNTSYIHESPYFKVDNLNRVSTELPSVIELEPKGNLIEEYPISRSNGNIRANFSKIEITSIAGIKYSFKDTERVKSNSQECDRYYCDDVSYVSSFMLNEMYDYATNQTVEFEYEEYSVGLVDEIEQPKAWYSGASTLRMINYNSLPKSTSKTEYPKRQRLKEIKFEDGSVEFEYNLNRQDNSYEKALTDIIIPIIN